MGQIFIISASSGAGKTTLVNELLKRINQYPIERVITYTSKIARTNEQNCRDYYFISPEEFKQKIADGFFLEYSTAYGTYYGSPRSILDGIKKGKSYVLIIDRIGAQKVVKRTKEAVLIWIYTKDLGILEFRLKKRSTENSEQIEKRLAQARYEMDLESKYPLYHYHVLNEDFEVAVTKLEGIVKGESDGLR